MRNRALLVFLRNWVLIAIGVGLAAHIIEGINYDSGWTLFLVVLLLSLFNVFLKPLLVVFTLPFIVLTLGLGIWVINAVLLWLVGYMINGFSVDTFSTALWGALVISLVSMLANMIRRSTRPTSNNRNSDRISHRDSDKKDSGSNNDIIDI